MQCYRNEGTTPFRPSMPSLVKYKSEIRKDFFEDIGGVVGVYVQTGVDILKETNVFIEKNPLSLLCFSVQSWRALATVPVACTKAGAAIVNHKTLFEAFGSGHK